MELNAWNQFLEFSPPNRKILNELSSDSPAVPKIDEEKTEEEVPVSSAASASVPTSIYQTSSGQYSQYTHEHMDMSRTGTSVNSLYPLKLTV